VIGIDDKSSELSPAYLGDLFQRSRIFQVNATAIVAI
jgi:hypothetical protein